MRSLAGMRRVGQITVPAVQWRVAPAGSEGAKHQSAGGGLSVTRLTVRFYRAFGITRGRDRKLVWRAAWDVLSRATGVIGLMLAGHLILAG